MGMATVALVYDLVRRRFGRRAGFVAGLVLALTPISVAISRHNNPDALLVLCCTGALWALVRALEDGRTRWLVLCGALVGLGFEAKMAVALMVVPGIVAAYLWVAPQGPPRRAPPAARGRRRDGRRGRLLAGDRRAHPGLRPAVDLGHRRQLDLVADPRLQRARPAHGQAGGPGGAAGGRRAAVAGRWRVRRRHRLAAPAQPEHGRPGRLVPRLRDRLRCRGACRDAACAAPTPAPAG